MTDGLKAEHRKAIIDVLAANERVEAAVLFGSRATATHTPASDIDIALFGEHLTLTDQAKMAAAMDELPMAQQVDLLLYETIDSPALREHIERHGVEWYRRPQSTAETHMVEGAGGGNLSVVSEWQKWSQLDDQTTVEPLDVVADMFSGGTPSKANQDYWNGSIPWLTPKDMGQWFGVTDAKVSPQAIGNGTRLAPKEAIFIAVRGMSLHNEIRVIRSNESFAFNQDIKAIVARTCIDSLYLYYVLVSKKPELLNAVEAAGHGTGRLPTDKLKKLSIPRFCSRTEASIAHILETLDDKIEVNRRMNATLEAMARAIFKDWFVDFGPTRAKMAGRKPYLAPEIWKLFPDRLDDEGKPEGWESKPLDEIAEFLNGTALQKFPASDPEDSLPVIKIAELRGGITAKSNRASHDVPEKYVVKDGDFLFSWSGSLLAKFWTEGEGTLNQHLFKVTSERYPAWFFSEWVQVHLEEFQQIAASKATTMGHIQRKHLQAAMTNCPPDEIIRKLDFASAPLIDRAIQTNLESRTLAQIRDLFLPKLMSGEIRVAKAEKTMEGLNDV